MLSPSGDDKLDLVVSVGEWIRDNGCPNLCQQFFDEPKRKCAAICSNYEYAAMDKQLGVLGRLNWVSISDDVEIWENDNSFVVLIRVKNNNYYYITF